jgi:hypothetical protein
VFFLQGFFIPKKTYFLPFCSVSEILCVFFLGIYGENISLGDWRVRLQNIVHLEFWGPM